jgi:hypothetical protein
MLHLILKPKLSNLNEVKNNSIGVKIISLINFYKEIPNPTCPAGQGWKTPKHETV